MRAIADTGFLVALARENDTHHAWARQVASRIRGAALTCDAVLAEATFQLQSAAYVLGLLADESLSLEFDLKQEWPRVLTLASKYAERKPDLADLCLIRMSELHPEHMVLTTDRNDFTVYRRNGREVIPLVVPPRRR
ncbi:MAG TPA: PIN domain-containing protein [Terriglobales bacterium]|nr:PIN domain-containing protein [Terriglobales bacterium]